MRVTLGHNSFAGQPAELRIQKLYTKFDIHISKSDLKSEAKLAKAFMVLVKRKLQRDQICRNITFRKLLALVFAHTRDNAQDLTKTINMRGGY